MAYQLYREQQLECELSEAWSFFSNPHNLAKITPGNMRFLVQSKSLPQDIYEGLEIEYTLTPLLSIPVKWKTIITQVDYQKSFTDFQKQGPYKYWNHYHEFIPNENGVLMKDTVDYDLPFYFLGSLAHQLIVKNKLEQIFNFRFQILEKIFNHQRQVS